MTWLNLVIWGVTNTSAVNLLPFCAVPSVDYELKETGCCGFGGSFNVYNYDYPKNWQN
ncbi:MAG: hypothetical protein ACLR7Z_20285 [Bilophila wadsworthia]